MHKNEGAMTRIEPQQQGGWMPSDAKIHEFPLKF